MELCVRPKCRWLFQSLLEKVLAYHSANMADLDKNQVRISRNKVLSLVTFMSTKGHPGFSKFKMTFCNNLFLLSSKVGVVPSLERQVFGHRVQMWPRWRQFKWIWSRVSWGFWSIELEKWSVRMLVTIGPATFGVQVRILGDKVIYLGPSSVLEHLRR